MLKRNTTSDFCHSSMQSYVIEGVDFIGEVRWGVAELHLGGTRPRIKSEAILPQVSKHEVNLPQTSDWR